MMNSDMVVCPFDKTHLINRSRFQRHLTLCGQNHPGEEIEKCPFNAAHVCKKELMAAHKRSCPDKRMMESELISSLTIDTSRRGNITNPNTSDVHFEAGENWDDEATEPIFTFQSRGGSAMRLKHSQSENVLAKRNEMRMPTTQPKLMSGKNLTVGDSLNRFRNDFQEDSEEGQSRSDSEDSFSDQRAPQQKQVNVNNFNFMVPTQRHHKADDDDDDDDDDEQEDDPVYVPDITRPNIGRGVSREKSKLYSFQPGRPTQTYGITTFGIGRGHPVENSNTVSQQPVDFNRYFIGRGFRKS